MLINYAKIVTEYDLSENVPFFLRLLNLFDAIFRHETSTTLQQDKCLFVYLLLAEIFFPMTDDLNLFCFCFKSAE